MEDIFLEQAKQFIDKNLASGRVTTHQTDSKKGIDAIFILSGQDWEKGKEIMLSFAGLSYQDINMFRDISLEDMEIIKKIVKIKSLKREIERIKKEIEI